MKIKPNSNKVNISKGAIDDKKKQLTSRKRTFTLVTFFSKQHAKTANSSITVITTVGFLTSIALVFLVLQRFFPRLPQGGTLEISFIPLLLISYLYGFVIGIFTGGIVGFLSILLLPAGYLNPWQFILDGFLPYIAFAFAAFFWKNNFINYLLFNLVPILIAFISQVISGYLFFSTYTWGGFSFFWYSIVYNLVYYIPTFLLLLWVMKPICRSLKIFKL